MTTRPAPIAALHALDGIAVAGADALACQRWLRETKRVRGFLDAVEADVTAQLDALAEQGESFGSEAAHVNCSGVSSKDASKLKERSKTLGQAAGFADALASGNVTASHVDQLAAAAAHLTDGVRTSLFERSDDLLEHATHEDPGRFGRYVRDLARRLERDAGTAREAQQRRDTWLAITRNPATGMYDLRGALHPELGARVKGAVDRQVAALIKRGEAQGDPEFVDRTVNRNRLAADALGDLVAAGHGTVRPTVADIGLLIDATTLSAGEYHEHSVCETSDGVLMSVPSVRRLLCNGLVTPIIVGADGVPLNVGRTIRTANRQQRRALRAMYRTCAAEGCDTPFDQCEIHHIDPWEAGGRTDLDNQLPLCSRHHHLAHALGWRLHLSTDRTLTVTDRDGQLVMRTIPDMPHPARSASRRRTEPAPAGDHDHKHRSEPQPARLAS